MQIGLPKEFLSWCFERYLFTNRSDEGLMLEKLALKLLTQFLKPKLLLYSPTDAAPQFV